MISKFASYGKDRTEAIDRMRRALAEYEIGGIRTTVPFFHEIMEDEEFIDGKIDTGFISRWQERRGDRTVDIELADLAIIAAALSSADEVRSTQSLAAPQTSKWRKAGRLARLSQ